MVSLDSGGQAIEILSLAMGARRLLHPTTANSHVGGIWFTPDGSWMRCHEAAGTLLFEWTDLLRTKPRNAKTEMDCRDFRP